MPTWTALVLATPLFGLSLTPPALDGAMFGTPDAVVETVASLPMPGLLQVDDSLPDQESDSGSVGTVQAPDQAAQAEEDARYAADVTRRREIGQVHRALGIATWIAMTANLVIGMMQYSDLYGFGAGQDQNPCASGHGLVLNECYDYPWAHIISATTTSVLYGGTFILSLVMPDPNDASSGNGEFAQRLRIHEVLRWIHGIGMLAQIVIGAMLSNGVFGDRANDYNTLQVVADIHQAIGWVTWGALTGAAAVMLF